MNTTIEILAPPSFRMIERDYYSIVEACCFLRLSLDQFRKLRNELNIHPVSIVKPYAFRRTDVNDILVSLLAHQMLGLYKGMKYDTLLSPDEFFRHHLFAATVRYCHTNRIALERLFKQAVQIYKVFNTGLN